MTDGIAHWMHRHLHWQISVFLYDANILEQLIINYVQSQLDHLGSSDESLPPCCSESLKSHVSSRNEVWIDHTMFHFISEPVEAKIQVFHTIMMFRILGHNFGCPFWGWEVPEHHTQILRGCSSSILSPSLPQQLHVLCLCSRKCNNGLQLAVPSNSSPCYHSPISSSGTSSINHGRHQCRWGRVHCLPSVEVVFYSNCSYITPLSLPQHRLCSTEDLLHKHSMVLLHNLSRRFLMFVLYINLKFQLGVSQLELIWIHWVPPSLLLVISSAHQVCPDSNSSNYFSLRSSPLLCWLHQEAAPKVLYNHIS